MAWEPLMLLLIDILMQNHMQQYAKIIVNLLKSERLFASQGGPIILSQVYTKSTKQVDLHALSSSPSIRSFI